MPTDVAGVNGLNTIQFEFVESLGQEGLARLGRIVFRYMEIADSGDRATMRAFRNDSANVSDLGSSAQRYLDRLLNNIDRQTGQSR